MTRAHKLIALTLVGSIAGVLAFSPALRAANTVLFSSQAGDVTFPLSPPTNAGATPGALDNTTIGGTTPADGTFNNVTVNTSVTNKGSSLTTQGAPNAQTVSATLTAANLLTRIITVNQGGAAASALQLPLATAMDTALPASIAGTAFDFSLINISTVAAESASITTNTGWTLVGDADVQANSAATTKSAGRFMARKTGTGAWTLYRLS